MGGEAPLKSWSPHIPIRSIALFPPSSDNFPGNCGRSVITGRRPGVAKLGSLIRPAFVGSLLHELTLQSKQKLLPTERCGILKLHHRTGLMSCQ